MLLKTFPNAADCSLIVQRMVFGSAGGVSGNGICCNYPESHGENRMFRGIFLSHQQGIQLRSGAWGTPQVDLAELENICPTSYNALKLHFHAAQDLFGPNPYFEFTLEAGELFILQHEERVRFVADD